MVYFVSERAHPARRVGERLSPHAGRRPTWNGKHQTPATDSVGTGSSAGNRPENHPGTGTGTGIPLGEAGEGTRGKYPAGAPVVSADAEEVVWGMEMVSRPN